MTCKNEKKKCRSKTHFNDPIKKCVNLTAKLLTYAYKPNIIKFKLVEDPLHRQVYFLYFMNSLKMLFS